MKESVIKNRSIYTVEELKALDCIVNKEKPKAKALKADKEFSLYIKKITTPKQAMLQSRGALKGVSTRGLIKERRTQRKAERV